MKRFLPLDTLRIVLIVAAAVVIIDIYAKWEKVNAPPQVETESPFSGAIGALAAPASQPPSLGGADAPSPAATAPVEAPDITIRLPKDPVEDSLASQPSLGVPQADLDDPLLAAKPPASATTHQPITVDTELVRIAISPLGGQIIWAEMKKHPLDINNPEKGYSMLSLNEANYQVVQSGLISRGEAAPTHHAHYQLAEGGIRQENDGLTTVIPLVHTNGGLRTLKEIRLDNSHYRLSESYTIDNTLAEPVNVRLYCQVSAAPRGSEQSFIASYFGGGYYQEDDGYRKLDYDTFIDERLKLDVSDGWLAMIEHYFIAAMVPPAGELWSYYTRTTSESGRTRYLIGAYGPIHNIAAGARSTLAIDYYLGPKHHDQLAQSHPELDQSIDYGILSFLSKPMFWLLDFFHDWTHNWGWAIVLLTIVVRALLYKPAEISFRSMARMREATPEIQRVRDQYKDNREQMGIRMMEVYKKRRINPLSGCLPILLQIPVFIALYWMLLESIELRQTPWILWIEDLSTPDPYYVLPILMGGFMVVQQKLNPAPLDPTQQKVFAAMPIVLGGISLFFPAGLVLYWTVNNALSILQQWLITKRVHEQELRRRAG